MRGGILLLLLICLGASPLKADWFVHFIHIYADYDLEKIEIREMVARGKEFNPIWNDDKERNALAEQNVFLPHPDGREEKHVRKFKMGGKQIEVMLRISRYQYDFMKILINDRVKLKKGIGSRRSTGLTTYIIHPQGDRLEYYAPWKSEDIIHHSLDPEKIKLSHPAILGQNPHGLPRFE